MALLFALLLPGRGALAQSESALASRSDARRSRAQSSIDSHVRQLAKALNLSEAQQFAVRTILQQRQVQAWKLRSDPTVSGSVRIDKFRAIQEHTVEQIRALLNEEQKEKYDPLAVRKLQPAADQRSVEDWLNLTTRP